MKPAAEVAAWMVVADSIVNRIAVITDAADDDYITVEYQPRYGTLEQVAEDTRRSVARIIERSRQEGAEEMRRECVGLVLATYAAQSDTELVSALSLLAESMRGLKHESVAAVNVNDMEEMKTALREALDGWEYAAQYKLDPQRKSHGDADDIARLRRLLEEPTR